MQNLRETYTYKDRLEFQDTILTMRPYILPLLLLRQNIVAIYASCQKVNMK